MNGPETLLIEHIDGLLKGRLALQDSASPWTVSHLDLTSFSVDFQIVVFQPHVSEDYLVSAEIGYLSYYLFSMTLEINDYFGVISDVTSRATCSIHVVYQYGVWQWK